jgi:hypothetical protein
MRLRGILTLALPLLATVAIASCRDVASTSAPFDGGDDGRGDGGAGACSALFGLPSAHTGLGADRCGPSCACSATPFTPPTYDGAFVDALLHDWQLQTPYAPLTEDPYAGPAPEPDPPDTVCAVVAGADAGLRPIPYDLVTFPSEEAARAAGARVTHFGRCGVCSPLADLAVYVRETDLTAPARACAMATSPDASDGGASATVACLEALGFDRPCAQAWAFDSAHTRETCLAVCIANLTTPYNLEDGSLNPCIQCDEDQSGPVFKAVAGRTRRNSGLANAICRPCSEVRPLVHRY